MLLGSDYVLARWSGRDLDLQLRCGLACRVLRGSALSLQMVNMSLERMVVFPISDPHPDHWV
jgi:hypothetical protein